jgi:hypothetical protein
MIFWPFGDPQRVEVIRRIKRETPRGRVVNQIKDIDIAIPRNWIAFAHGEHAAVGRKGRITIVRWFTEYRPAPAFAIEPRQLR